MTGMGAAKVTEEVSLVRLSERRKCEARRKEAHVHPVLLSSPAEVIISC